MSYTGLTDAGRAQRRRRWRRAFSLVELLVALAILAVLIALLLPVLRSAQEASRRAACLSNIRQVTMAALAYAREQDGYLPEAGTTNAPVMGPLSPRTWSMAPFTPLPDSFMPGAYVLPSIGGALRPYLAVSRDAWRCPGAGDDKFAMSGDDPFNGRAFSSLFIPSYGYMSDKEWFKQASLSGSAFTQQYRFRDWAARNVAGLRLAKASSSQPPSQVVLFHERESTYHTRPPRDVYNYPHDADYYASFGYVDGHAEGMRYRNLDGYIGALHRPIRQRWYGREFEAAFPEQYR